MVKYTVVDYDIRSWSIWLHTEEQDKPIKYNGVKLEQYDLGYGATKAARFTDDGIWYSTRMGNIYKIWYQKYNMHLEYPDEWHIDEETAPFDNICSFD